MAAPLTFIIVTRLFTISALIGIGANNNKVVSNGDSNLKSNLFKS